MNKHAHSYFYCLGGRERKIFTSTNKIYSKTLMALVIHTVYFLACSYSDLCTALIRPILFQWSDKKAPLTMAKHHSELGSCFPLLASMWWV